MSHPTVPTLGSNVPLPSNDQVNNQNQNTNTISKGRFSVTPNTSKNVKLVVLGIVASIAILAVLASIGVSIAHTQTNVPFASNLLNGMGNLSLIPQIAIPVVGSLIAGGAIYGMKKVKQKYYVPTYHVNPYFNYNNNNNNSNSYAIRHIMPDDNNSILDHNPVSNNSKNNNNSNSLTIRHMPDYDNHMPGDDNSILDNNNIIIHRTPSNNVDYPSRNDRSILAIDEMLDDNAVNFHDEE